MVCDDAGQWHDVWVSRTAGGSQGRRVEERLAETVFGVVMWSEFGGKGPTWGKMPSHMLAKVAEKSRALRKAFPAEMSGLYTNEEMAQADRPATVDTSHLMQSVPASCLDTSTGEVFEAEVLEPGDE